MPTTTARSVAYTVLVRNRLATRSTFAITRRPSAITGGSAAKEVSSSTSSATARLGERVVDAVARHRPRVARALQGVDHGALLPRRHPAEHRTLEHQPAELFVVD